MLGNVFKAMAGAGDAVLAAAGAGFAGGEADVTGAGKAAADGGNCAADVTAS